MKPAIKHLALATALLVTTVATAQGGHREGEKKSPEERAEHLTARMTETLDLTPEQTGRVKEINLRYAQALTDVRNEAADPEVKRARAKDLKERRDTELGGVLTTEQYERMKTERARAHQEMKARRKAAEGRPEERPHNE
jgi:hypothetical protein